MGGINARLLMHISAVSAAFMAGGCSEKLGGAAGGGERWGEGVGGKQRCIVRSYAEEGGPRGQGNNGERMETIEALARWWWPTSGSGRAAGARGGGGEP